MTTRTLHSFLQHLRRSIRQPLDAALSDTQLLERWTARRDQAAFELLLWRHGPMVLNICRRLLRREDIEDAFQATFLVLVRKAGSIRRRESLAAWLHRVACRIALRARATSARRAGREQPLVDVPAAADGGEVVTRDLRAMLDEEIDRLPAHYRRALILCCLQGKSQEEASRLLACPRGTVSSWLTRGRERLRQRLLRRGVVLSAAATTAALASDASAGGLAPLIALLRGTTASGAVSVGMMSSQAIALAEGMLRTMLLTKVKIAAAVLLVGALFAAGIGTISHSTQAADPQTEPRESKETPKDFRRQSRDEKEGWNDWNIGLRLSRNEGIAWGKAAHGLQAGIAFRPGDQENYTVGESVTFAIYLRNVSKKEIRLSHIEPLFAEFMPTVEDGDGKRLRAAPAPINLGDVPIVHRTLEPGERITLGYPWFRIRPAGWRGEVLGPTCCAAPGRYKVGYVGLSLRLNEDKFDVSGPGTGQVELDIRQSDAPKDNQPAKKQLDSRVPAKAKEPAFKAWGMIDRQFDATGSMSFFQMRDRPAAAPAGTAKGKEESKSNDANEVTLSGPGSVRLMQCGGADLIAAPGQPAANQPGASPKQTPDKQVPMLTYVRFEQLMKANSRTNTATFWGSVRVLNFPCGDPHREIDLDVMLAAGLPVGAMYLRSDRLKAHSYQRTERSPQEPNKVIARTYQEMEAHGKVVVQSKEFFAQADHMTFNEEKDQVIFIGEGGHQAVLEKRYIKGGQPQVFRARKIIYIRSTGKVWADSRSNRSEPNAEQHGQGQ